MSIAFSLALLFLLSFILFSFHPLRYYFFICAIIDMDCPITYGDVNRVFRPCIYNHLSSPCLVYEDIVNSTRSAHVSVYQPARPHHDHSGMLSSPIYIRHVSTDVKREIFLSTGATVLSSSVPDCFNSAAGPFYFTWNQKREVWYEERDPWRELHPQCCRSMSSSSCISRDEVRETRSKARESRFTARSSRCLSLRGRTRIKHLPPAF